MQVFSSNKMLIKKVKINNFTKMNGASSKNKLKTISKLEIESTTTILITTTTRTITSNSGKSRILQPQISFLIMVDDSQGLLEAEENLFHLRGLMITYLTNSAREVVLILVDQSSNIYCLKG